MERARKVLGVAAEEDESKIRYAYYRRMSEFHPDRNGRDAHAHEKTALINEAFSFVMGRRHDALLLKEDSLVAALTSSVVTRLEGVLTYEEWLKTRFYNTSEHSIWAY